MRGKIHRIEALEARRLLSAGSLDTAFGSNGVAYPQLVGNFQKNSERIAFQSDGKMIIAAIVTPKGSSNSELELLRLTAKGHDDSTFGNAGDVTLSATTSNWTIFQLNSADQIYVQIGQKLIRFSSDGKTRTTLANTSNLDRLGNESILNNGKIIVRKGDTIERLKSNGALDTSFGTQGKITIARETSGGDSQGAPMHAYGLSIQHDGGILVWLVGGDSDAGETESGLLRITSGGKVDQAYGDHGFVEAEEAVEGAISTTNGLTIVQTVYDAGGYSLYEFDAHGNPVKSFGENGFLTLLPNENGGAGNLYALPNGKIGTDFVDAESVPQSVDELVRLNADGSYDNTFNGTGRVQLPDYRFTQAIFTSLPTPGGDVIDYGVPIDGARAGQLVILRYSGGPPVDSSSIATLSGAGVLNVFGTAKNDTINVSGEDPVNIYCTVNGEEAVFSEHAVKAIVIHAGTGNDQVTADTPIGATIIGDDGNDTLTGSGFNDAIHGGAGDDSIIGGDGNDSLWGDSGNDTMLGGNGNDRLNANDGQVDSLDGGGGRDTASSDQSDSVRDDVLNIEKVV